jgi:hypothetical protein
MTTTKSTKQRVKRAAKWSAVPLGLAASGVLVLGYSNAAFTAQTSNAGNNWSTGTVSLTNNLTKPMFDYTATPANKSNPDKALAPGDSLSNTIKVDYSSGNAATIKVFATPGSDAASIAQYIDVKINDGATDIYTGTLANLTTANSNFATGLGTWNPAGTDSKTYTFTATLKNTAPDTAAGKSITGTSFTWEAHAA